MLTLVTWNVRYFGHGTRGIVALQSGFDAIAQAIAALSPLPDIIALQEVEAGSLRGGAEHQLDRLTAALSAAIASFGASAEYTALYFPAHGYAVPGASLYTQGLAVLVRAPHRILEHQAIDVTHRRFRLTARLKQTRVCAHVRVAVDGNGTLDLFNTHLSLPAFISPDLPRLPWRMGHGMNQLEEARAVTAFVDAHRGPHAVLVGDFNSLPGSPAYDHIVSSGALADAFTQPRGALHTWTTAGFFGIRMHLDHVFCTPDVRFLSFEASHAYGEPGPFHGLSDHVPKIGRLELL